MTVTDGGTVADSDGLAPGNPSGRSAAFSGRDPRWVVLLVFGVIVMGAIPFYWMWLPPIHTGSCMSTGAAHWCSSGFVLGLTPLGGAFNAGGNEWGLGRWNTIYWTASLAFACSAVIAMARRLGWAKRMQKFMIIGTLVVLGLSGLILLDTNVTVITRHFDLTRTSWWGLSSYNVWDRGMAPLLLIAIFVGVMALVDRSPAFIGYAAGFSGLALLSNLYNVENVFWDVGVPFRIGYDQEFNIVLPGIYLIGGAGVYWWRGRPRTSLSLTG